MNKHVRRLATTPLVVAGIAGAMISPAFADETGTLVGCDDLQQAIDSAVDAPSITYLTLSENCSKDIVIPTNKNIVLGTYQGSVLSGSQGDTITVQEGATLYLKGGNYQNSIAGRSIINNSGLTVIDYDHSVGVGVAVPSLTAGTDAANWIINNSGEMNILSAVINSEFNTVNDGTLRIKKGGTNIDEERIAEYLVTGNCNTVLLNSIPKYVPAGYNMSGNTPLSPMSTDDDSICGRHIYSSDYNIIGFAGTVSGDSYDFSFEAKQAGTTDIHEDLWENVNGNTIMVYDLKSNVEGLADNPNLIGYIGEEYGRYYGGQKNDLILALENGEDISVDLNINKLDAKDVDEDDAAKINAALNNGKILAYGDISLTINASESGLIGGINLLGGCAAGPDGEFCDEQPIDVKWGGLELGEPAAGYERNFFVIRLHNGKAEKIAAEVDKDGNLVFPSGKFSTYVAAYEDVEIVVEDAEESEIEAKAETPETGANTQANSGMIISLLGCMATGIAVALMLLPKIRKYLDNRKA